MMRTLPVVVMGTIVGLLFNGIPCVSGEEGRDIGAQHQNKWKIPLKTMEQRNLQENIESVKAELKGVRDFYAKAGEDASLTYLGKRPMFMPTNRKYRRALLYVILEEASKEEKPWESGAFQYAWKSYVEEDFDDSLKERISSMLKCQQLESKPYEGSREGGYPEANPNLLLTAGLARIPESLHIARLGLPDDFTSMEYSSWFTKEHHFPRLLVAGRMGDQDAVKCLLGLGKGWLESASRSGFGADFLLDLAYVNDPKVNAFIESFLYIEGPIFPNINPDHYSPTYMHKALEALKRVEEQKAGKVYLRYLGENPPGFEKYLEIIGK